MLKNKFNLFVFINTTVLLLVIIFLFFKFFVIQEKIVYVDNAKLFDGFNMTKESKTIGEKEFNFKKKALDSLYAIVQSNAISEEEKKGPMQQFIALKEQFEQFNQAFGMQESEKIWKRINGYTEDFAKENNYELIIGSDNKRDVHYASKKIDITNELLTYINKKYEGIK